MFLLEPEDTSVSEPSIIWLVTAIRRLGWRSIWGGTMGIRILRVKLFLQFADLVLFLILFPDKSFHLLWLQYRVYTGPYSCIYHDSSCFVLFLLILLQLFFFFYLFKSGTHSFRSPFIVQSVNWELENLPQQEAHSWLVKSNIFSSRKSILKAAIPHSITPLVERTPGHSPNPTTSSPSLLNDLI